MARRVQIGLAGLLCLLVSLEVAPHAGCGTACWAAEALGMLYAGVTGVLLVDGSLEAGAGYLTALCQPSQWRRLPRPRLHDHVLRLRGHVLQDALVGGARIHVLVRPLLRQDLL